MLGSVEQTSGEKCDVHLISVLLLKKSLLCLAVSARMNTVAAGEKGVYPI